MHNVDYYSNSGKPGEKPVRSYVFDAREPKLRVLDPLRSALERPEQMELIEMNIALEPFPDVRGEAHPTQPFYLAQIALIRECGDMAKYDGYKWAAFIDYDEYISVRGDKSMEEYTEGLPNGTVSVIIPRVPPPENIRTVPERWAAETLVSFAASWVHTQAQWNVSNAEHDSLFPPKYIVNLESAKYDSKAGRPGSVHLPYNFNWAAFLCSIDIKREGCVVPRGAHVADRWSEAVIRHISTTSINKS
jgi:hypothetical protein